MLIEPYNFPLWFLRSLFFSYIFYYVIQKSQHIYKGWVTTGIVLLLSFLSWKVSFILPKGGWSFLLENITTSLFALPFIYVATLVRRKGLLTKVFTKKELITIFGIGLIAWIVCVQDNVFFYCAHLGNRYPLLYLSAFGGIACLWVICLNINKLPFFSYLGRYSIVVLGTFAPICHFLSVYFDINGVVQAILTLLVMPVMIYVFTHLFPHFTAQKDLIKVYLR